MSQLKIKKGREAKVDSFEIKFICSCGGTLYPDMSVKNPNKIDYTLRCTKCNKVTNASIIVNQYEVIE